MKSGTNRQVAAMVGELNRIIHTQNLYCNRPTVANASYRVRLIHAQIVLGDVCAVELNTGKLIKIAGLELSNARGEKVECEFDSAPISALECRVFLKAAGVKFKSLPETGEYRVTGKDGSDYFTTDIRDALETGRKFAQCDSTCSTLTFKDDVRDLIA